MNSTLEPDGFEERLLPTFRDAVSEAKTSGVLKETGGTQGRAPRRRARRIALLAAAVTLALSVALFTGAASGGRLVATVDGLRALQDPAAVEQELRAKGIDATIVAVPVHHGEGEWWWVAVDRSQGISQEDFDRLYAQIGSMPPPGVDSIPTEDPHILELPKMSGHVTLFVGREVPDSQFSVELYDRMNELSPTGSFYCLGIDPNDPVALGNAITNLGYQIIWMVESHNHGETVTTPPPGTVATWAWLGGPDLVDIRLTPAGPEAEKYQEAEGTFPSGTTPPWAQPCA